MNRKIMAIMAMVTAAVGAFTFTACRPKPEPLTDSPLTGTTLADFTQGKAKAVFASDGWSNESVFNAVWSADRVNYENGAMSLSLAVNPEGSAETNNGYFGGEARTHQYFGYGDYEVKMKPAKKTGTASTFFTCTGPYDVDEDGNENPWDEIDIEFLGKDTTKVQFNYYVNGEGGHEHMHDLGFDASAEYHEYGYRWTKDYIVWFVDDKPVYKVTASEKTPLPSTPGRILMNYWSGTPEAEGWMGVYSDPDDKSADYQWIKTSATPIGEIPEEEKPLTPSDVPAEGWTDIDYSGFGFGNGYTVDKTNGLTISHTEAKNEWACEGMTLADSYSWIKFTMKNNAASAAKVRVDVKQENKSGSVNAVISESAKATLDAAEKAAMIELGANETVDIALRINNEKINQFVVFLNSMQASGGVAEGSITITGLKGIINENLPEEPDPAPSGDNCSLTFTSTEEYNVDKSGEAAQEITVTYTNIKGGSYKNIQAPAASLAADKDNFSVTIKNNGATDVMVRVDLIGERKVTVGDNPNMECCNLSAIAVSGADGVDYSTFYTETTWGGTMITVKAGKEVTIAITYSNTNDMGAVQRVQFYLDTALNNDANTYSGNVTLSNFKFSSSTAEE